MPFVFKRLALLMSIAAAFAADKEAPVQGRARRQLAAHQTNAKITIGVDPYVTDDKVKAAFGKLEPLPIWHSAGAGGDPERQRQGDPAGSPEG